MDVRDEPGYGGPGPGAYDLGSTIGQTQKFTLKGRVAGGGMESSGGPTVTMGTTERQWANIASAPGPGSYTLPDATGRNSPSFTLKGRTAMSTRSDSPGPGQYGASPPRSYSPSFTLKGRPALPQDRGSGPGVGSYYAENYGAIGTTGRHSSLASRTRTIRDDTRSPGPAAYTIPTRPTGRSVSLAGRPQLPHEGGASPGPAAYNCTQSAGSLRSSSPAFSLGGRPRTPNYAGSGVGPGHYNLVDVSKVRKGSPSFTLHGRSALPLNGASSPGPAAYTLPSANGGRSATLAGRTYVKSRDSTPGPGAYSEIGRGFGATQARAPSPSLGGRTEVRSTSDTPGPGSYTLPTTIGSGARSATLASRTAALRDDRRSPGPAAYYPPARSSSPQFSLASRTRAIADGSASPGPAAYDVTSKRSGVAFSMSGRPERRGGIMY